MVKIEVFSDVICPWCAIGKRRLEGALGRFEHADEVDVEWRAYELDPKAPAERDGSYVDRLARKYGLTHEQAVAANERLTRTAAADGLDFAFDRVRPGNTFDAHRLLHYAREVGAGAQDALKERLFLAYFTQGAPIGVRDTLVRLAGEAGLDPEASLDVLESGRYGDEVREDERQAFELGVTGVPFFVVDGKFAIPGAQDAETILRVLERAWAKAHPVEVVVAAPPAVGAGACDGDGCTV